MTPLEILPRPNPTPEEQARRQQEVAQAGPPTILDTFLGRGPYMEEYKKRRHEVLEDYTQQKRHLREDWKRQEREQKRELTRREEKIERHYRVPEFEHEGDPRAAQAAAQAQKKFDDIQRRTERDWRRQKAGSLLTLRSQRTEAMRDISRQLRAPLRRHPGQSGGLSRP